MRARPTSAAACRRRATRRSAVPVQAAARPRHSRLPAMPRPRWRMSHHRSWRAVPADRRTAHSPRPTAAHARPPPPRRCRLPTDRPAGQRRTRRRRTAWPMSRPRSRTRRRCRRVPDPPSPSACLRGMGRRQRTQRHRLSPHLHLRCGPALPCNHTRYCQQRDQRRQPHDAALVAVVRAGQTAGDRRIAQQRQQRRHAETAGNLPPPQRKRHQRAARRDTQQRDARMQCLHPAGHCERPLVCRAAV